MFGEQNASNAFANASNANATSSPFASANATVALDQTRASGFAPNAPFGASANAPSAFATPTAMGSSNVSFGASHAPHVASAMAFGASGSTFGAPANANRAPFGAPSPFSAPSTVATAFGAPSTVASMRSRFGASASTFEAHGSGASPFGDSRSSASPVGAFASSASPSFGGPGTAASPFGGPGTSTSPFGAAGTSTSPFGAAGTSTSPFGASGTAASPFGGPGTAASPFGGPGTSPSPFGASGTSPSPFGAAGTSTSPFGGPGTSTSPFGASGTAASPFGASGTSPSPFGAPATSPSPFGAPATSPSPFGAAGTAASSFGAPATSPSPFGASGTAASPFGAAGTSPSPFGASGTAASSFGASGTAASSFGASGTSPSPFGASGTSPSPFGAPASIPSPFGAPVSGTTPFGAPASIPSPFGAPASGTTPIGASALATVSFGAPTTSPSPFGATASGTSPLSASAPIASSFGTPAPGPSIFGSPAPASSPFGGLVFGSSAPTASTPFAPNVHERAPAPTSFGFVAAPPPLASTSGIVFGGGLSVAATPFTPTFGSAASTVVAPSPFGLFGAPKTVEEKRETIASVSAVAGGNKGAFTPPKPRQQASDRVDLGNIQSPPLKASPSPSKSRVNADGEILDMTTGYVVGTCELMCPEKERDTRSANGDLELFERANAEDRTTSHPDLCVKKYTRIVDGITPDMVRTPQGLQLAIDQLWRILDGRDESFMTKSKFVWDRLRSIRQDLSLQQITDSFAVKLMEQMVRYTILAEHELCEEAASATNPDGHNSHLNVEQLTKTLTSLRHMYDDHAGRDMKLSVDAESEMFCYQLLLRIDSHGRYAVQRSEMLNDLRGVRPEVLKHKDVQFALECNRVYHENNFSGFFRLVKQATYLQACCLHKFFNSMRGKALEVMDATYGKTVVAIPEIARLIHTDDIEAEALSLHHGLTVSRGIDGDKEPAVMFRESSYISPAEEFPISRSELVDSKRAPTYLLEIAGKEEATRIMAKKLPVFTAAKALPAPTGVTSQNPQTETEKRKAQADDLRAKIAERAAALATERAAIEAKKKEIEERKDAEKRAALEEERKAKEAAEAARKAENEAQAAEAKARAEAEAAEVERKRVEHETARAKAEAEARVIAEAERRRAEAEAERQRIEAERRAKEAAEAARLAAIAKAEAEERARKAARAEAERQRLIAEENARRAAAAAKAARQAEKMRLARARLMFSRWRMNSKEFKRERLINAALFKASPAPAFNVDAAQQLLDARASSTRLQDVLAQLRYKMEMSRSPELGAAMDMPKTIGLALNQAAVTASPSALVWKCILCTGAEADMGSKASPRSRTAAATLAAEWLRKKMSRGGSAHKTDPNTGSILSLYGTRLPSLDENEHAIGPLAWIIVRDVPAMMEHSAGADAGASAAIFILDCGIGSCEKHELDRLRAFYSAARINEAPVVIMVATRENFSGQAEHDIRGTIENAGVKGALVIFLNPQGPEHWTDEKLARALVFLAERAPKAPRRRIAHIASEVEEALRPGYVDLTIKPRVSANACVAAFNHALDQVERKISEAARSDDAKQWPPVEIGLVNAALPPPGWRSEEKRAKVINALRSVRLPPFATTDTPARAFIDYINKVLPSYPPEYGRCMLAQARYDPHFHKVEDIPWIALFQSLITMLLNRLEGITKGECIYLPPGHPSYVFTPYEPEPELLTSAEVRTPDTPPLDDLCSPPRKRKITETTTEPSVRFEELESAPADGVRAVMEELKRNIKAQSVRVDASERWLAALASDAPGTLDVPDAFVADVDVHLARFHAQLAEERATDARLRAMLGSL